MTKTDAFHINGELKITENLIMNANSKLASFEILVGHLNSTQISINQAEMWRDSSTYGLQSDCNKPKVLEESTRWTSKTPMMISSNDIHTDFRKEEEVITEVKSVTKKVVRPCVGVNPLSLYGKEQAERSQMQVACELGFQWRRERKFA